METQHYRVPSDLAASLVREMAEELEWCYALTPSGSARWHPKKDAERERHEVRLYANQADYLDTTRSTPAGPATAAACTTRGTPALAFLGDGGRGGLKKTLRHEAFHQYAYEAIGPGLPLWVNEGLAQLFEHGVRVDDHLLLGELPVVPLQIVRPARATGDCSTSAGSCG